MGSARQLIEAVAAGQDPAAALEYEGVTVDTSPYRRAHGKEPRGTGLWRFEFDGGETLDAGGSYAEKVQDAKRYAASHNISVVKVLP